MIRAVAAAALSLVAASAAAQTRVNDELVERIRGTWEVVNADGTVVQDCNEGQHFEPDLATRHILLTHLGSDQTRTYVVVRTERNSILTYIQDEDRLTDAGAPVRWWAQFSGRDRFRWRRDDWPRNGLSAGEWIRCKAE